MKYLIGALGAALLVAVGFFVGSKQAKIQDGYVDLSTMPAEMRSAYSDPVQLSAIIENFTGEAQQADPYVVLPEGVPTVPGLAWMKKPNPSMTLPDAALLGLDPEATLAFESGWTIINLWASWCAPCIAEMPDFDEAVDTLADAGVSIYLVNLDMMGKDTLETVEKIYRERGVTRLLPLISENEKRILLTEALGLNSLRMQYPMTIIFAPGGEPFGVILGGPKDESMVWSSPDMLVFFEALNGAYEG